MSSNQGTCVKIIGPTQNEGMNAVGCWMMDTSKWSHFSEVFWSVTNNLVPLEFRVQPGALLFWNQNI